jgi:hypothetical protein
MPQVLLTLKLLELWLLNILRLTNCGLGLLS